MSDTTSETPKPPSDGVLLLDELSALLKTSPRSVRRRVEAGVFPIRRLHGIDKKWRWSTADVQRFLQTGRKVG